MTVPVPTVAAPPASGRLADGARLLVACPERPGIVSAVTGFLERCGANILCAHQYTTHPEHGRLFLRIEFDQRGLDSDHDQFEREFTDTVANKAPPPRSRTAATRRVARSRLAVWPVPDRPRRRSSCARAPSQSLW
jgi:formyltetrahydrofolate hydrolase